MTISLADASTQLLAEPRPVVLLDTCNLLDLFRVDEAQTKTPYRPRVPEQEILAAAGLLSSACQIPRGVHLIVPELVPGEFFDHADAVQAKFHEWTTAHDGYQDWLVAVALAVGVSLAVPSRIHPAGLAGHLRRLADDLLAQTRVLDRDSDCLNLAVQRLIRKSRPSHKKEIKDSMNLEQCLELSRRLEQVGYPNSRVWVSSNTSDFAQGGGSTRVHSDLQADFVAAGLKYFPSLQSTLGHLKGLNEL